MKKYICILATCFSLVLFFATMQPVLAATGENDPNCQCTNPKNPDEGKNGFTCSGNVTSNYCPAKTDCQNSINGPICVDGTKNTFKEATEKSPSNGENNPKCQCTHPASMKGGENGFTCSGKTTSSSCSANFFCQDNPKTGPTCVSGETNNGTINDRYCISRGDPCDNRKNQAVNNLTCCGKDSVCGSTGTCVSKETSGFADKPAPPPNPCPKKINAKGGCQSVQTALGEWNTDPSGFVKSLFGILLSFSGGIAVLILVISGYKIMLSNGDPEKVAAAKESITAAIVGLLFLIFSFVILQVIGVDILHLPGFGTGQSNFPSTNEVSDTSSTAGSSKGGNQACQQKYGTNAQCMATNQGDVCKSGVDNDPALCGTGSVCCESSNTTTFTCGGTCITSDTRTCPDTQRHDPKGDVACTPNANTCCIPSTANNNQCGCTVNTDCKIQGQYCQDTTKNDDGSYKIYQCQQDLTHPNTPLKSSATTWNFVYSQKSPACQ